MRLCTNTDNESRIVEELVHEDRLSISLIDSQFRKFMVPQLLSSIVVSTDDDRFYDLSQLCSKYGNVIERLHLRCQLHPGPENMFEVAGTVKKPPPKHLAQQFQNLVNGQTLPAMRSLQITFLPEQQFTYDREWSANTDEFQGSISVHQEPESYEDVIASEAIYTWRVVMNDLFNSMAANTSIRSLELTDLMPKMCSTWQSTEWQCFMDRLEDVKIELWGGDNGAG